MGNLDRRSFLKGGVVAAGAAAFAGTLSACAPSAPQEAAGTDASLPTTGEPWYGSPADPATFDVIDTVDCEVLVCGLGAGGITATAAAAEKGMNVIAIEKGSGHGSIKSDIGVIGTRIDTVEVDPLQMLNEHTRYANGWCDPRVTRVWATESGATFDWISDSIAEFGATPYFEYDVDEGTHGVWPGTPPITASTTPILKRSRPRPIKRWPSRATLPQQWGSCPKLATTCCKKLSSGAPICAMRPPLCNWPKMKVEK